MPRRHLPATEVAQIIALLEEGFRVRHVVHHVGVSISVVSRVWSRYQETRRYTKREGSSRDLNNYCQTRSRNCLPRFAKTDNNCKEYSQ